MNSHQTLYVLETAADVSVWLAKYNMVIDGVVVALSAEASQCLNDLNVEHNTIEDFYSEEDLLRYAEDGVTQAIELCNVLDGLLNVSFEKQLPEFSAHYYVAQLVVFRDNFQNAAFVLKALLDKIQPTKIVAVHVSTPSVADESNIIIEDARFFTWVLIEIAAQQFIDVSFFYSAIAVKKKPLLLKARIKNFMRFVRDYTRILTVKKTDIVYYNWPQYTNKAFREKGMESLCLPPILCFVNSKYKEIDTTSVWCFFEFNHVRLGNLAHPFLNIFLNEFRERHQACLKQYEFWIRRTSARGAISFCARTIENVAILLAARRLGRANIVMQHGGFTGYCKWVVMPLTDLNVNTDCMVYGKGVSDYIQSDAQKLTRVRDQKVSLHVVGSQNVADIYKAREKPNRQKKRVLYVTTFLVGSTRYFGGHLRPDISYLKIQRAMVGLLADYGDQWDVYFRPTAHPSARLITQGMSPDKLSKVNIQCEGDFISFLKQMNFDLIVSDAVTTVLLESLATSAKVITCFDPIVMSLEPKAKVLLEKRASVTFSKEDYLFEVEKNLNDFNSSDEINDEFLIEYALSEYETPAARQADVIESILQKDHRQSLR